MQQKVKVKKGIKRVDKGILKARLLFKKLSNTNEISFSLFTNLIPVPVYALLTREQSFINNTSSLPMVFQH